MMARLTMLALAAGALMAAGASAQVNPAPPDLWNYVHATDPMYKWENTNYAGYSNETGWKGYLLNVTSGSWLSPEDSSQYIWSHQVIVIVPDEIKDKTHASIYITGGDMNDGPPSVDDEDVLAALAMSLETGTVAVTIRQIPNQPIVFPSDPEHKARGEDALVAFTWMHLIKNPTDSDWVAYFPMTRAVLRAMDAVTEFAPTVADVDLQHWFAYGASKRGWITWLVGATDDRVVGIAPMVMDLLNFKPNIMHMYKNYGGWTFAFTDYCDVNLTYYLPTPAIDPLAALIDPLGYKANLTMPKLVVDATGDEFFQTDDDLFWWGDLDGETKRLMIYNAEHSLATGLIPFVESATGFWQSIILQSTRPEVSWTIDSGTGTIHLTTNVEPTKVEMHYTTTIQSRRRDFRLIRGDTPADPCTDGIPVSIFGKACLVPQIWLTEIVGPDSVDADGLYHYTLEQPLPASGWRGFLADITYKGPTDTTEYRFTSQVSIIPQTFPFDACTVCNCTLV